MNAITIDFETFYHKKDYSVAHLGNWAYVHEPRFDPYLVSVCDGEQTWVGQPKDLNWAALQGRTLVAHNAAFEQHIVARLEELKWIPELDLAGFHCSANMTSYLCDRRALDNACEFLLHEKVSKSMRDWMNGRTWADAVKEGKDAELITYARKDAELAWRLWDQFSPQWPEQERLLSDLTIEGEIYGIKIDRDLLAEYLDIAQRALIANESRLPWLAAGKKPTSPIAIAEECRKHGIPCPPVKADDEEGFQIWEDKWSPQFSWVQSVASWRQVNKFIATLRMFEQRCRPDGTVPVPLKYYGAHCFTGDAEVLTPLGWVRLDLWTGGDIMQLAGERLLFAPAVANTLDASGERLLTVKTGQIHFTVTQGHWLATRDKRGRLIKRQAEEVRHVRAHIPLSAQYRGGVFTWTARQVQLMVATQADGQYCSDGNALRFRLKRPRKIARLREILAASENITWHEQSSPSESDVTVFWISQVPEWLQRRKQWTHELLAWSSDALETLITELKHWDGTQCGPGSVEYSTTNRINAEWIATVAHLTGRAATISVKSLRPRGWSDCYRVFIRARFQTRVQPRNWLDQGPAGKVYCPTATHGICLFRQNGLIFISCQTGRWAGTSGLNFLNFRKEPIYLGKESMIIEGHQALKYIRRTVEESGSLPAEVSSALDVRKILVPRDGYKFILADLSQIEPRVLAWFCQDWEFLDKLAHGMSPYEAHARSTMGWKGGKLKDEDPKLYNLAKIRVLQLGYQSGWRKLQATAWTKLNIELADAEAQQIVTDFRAQSPRITKCWELLGRAFKMATMQHEECFDLELPSGRELHYGKPVRSARVRMNEDTGQLEKVSVITADVGGRRFSFYGGMLTENIVQATARDVFCEELLSLRRAGHRALFHVYDDVTLEVKPEVTTAEVERLMSVTPSWMPRLPVAAEAQEATHYKK